MQGLKCEYQNLEFHPVQCGTQQEANVTAKELM